MGENLLESPVLSCARLEFFFHNLRVALKTTQKTLRQVGEAGIGEMILIGSESSRREKKPGRSLGAQIVVAFLCWVRTAILRGERCPGVRTERSPQEYKNVIKHHKV